MGLRQWFRVSVYSVRVHLRNGVGEYVERTSKVLCMLLPRISRADQAVRNHMKQYTKKGAYILRHNMQYP